MKIIELVLITLLSFSCSNNDQITDTETETQRENFSEFVNPVDTDSQIDLINENFHYVVFNELDNARNELVVFLGGTMSKTSGTTIFSKFTANKGFHVINLAYPNLIPVKVCNQEVDIDCALKYRKEIFQGITGSEFISVNFNNSIENRLQKLLSHLKSIDPKGNWQQYLEDGQILWNKILIAGHSQGAGHAAFIANQKKVKRVLMFAGPNDYRGMPANWLSSLSKTPLTNYYAFLHLRDEVSSFNIQEQCLMELGFTTIFNTDESLKPFEMNNALFTNKEVGNQDGFGKTFHGSVVTDRTTPLEGGQPEHSDVWSYLLGVN